MSETITKKIVRKRMTDDEKEQYMKEAQQKEEDKRIAWEEAFKKRKALYEKTLKYANKNKWNVDCDQNVILNNNCKGCYERENWEGYASLCNICYDVMEDCRMWGYVNYRYTIA